MMCEDLSMLTVVQLKGRLRQAGLPVSGRKAELIERLGGHSINPSSMTPDELSLTTEASDSSYPAIIIEACKS